MPDHGEQEARLQRNVVLPQQRGQGLKGQCGAIARPTRPLSPIGMMLSMPNTRSVATPAAALGHGPSGRAAPVEHHHGDRADVRRFERESARARRPPGPSGCALVASTAASPRKRASSGSASGMMSVTRGDTSPVSRRRGLIRLM